jgi:hypothetical protein
MSELGVRPALADVFREEFGPDYLRSLLQDLKSSTKGVKADVTCRECGQRQYTMAQIPDYHKILQMALSLLEQTEGKPGTAGVEDAGVHLIVERSWPTPQVV